mmetsp:Transcript_24596/g.57754  ORF Transcript_24596/g.57754 Transcript_24596/m.57754 type:complete len:344 (-) Transcript_24596:1057-2088(-)
MVSPADELPSPLQEGTEGIESLGHVSTGIGNDKNDSTESGNRCDSGTQSNIQYAAHKPSTPRSHGLRLPAVKSSSVFERLYKSHTAASKRHTLSSRAMLKPSTRAKLPNAKDPQFSLDVEKDLLNFNRMTISRSKKVSTPHKIKLDRQVGNEFSFGSFSTPQPRHRKKRLSPYEQAPHTAPSKSSVMNDFRTAPRSAKRVYEFSPRMKPLTKLYFVSKFHPGVGPELIEPISLGYTFFQTFCEYETGGIDFEHIAKEIFLAFFKKDHSQGIRHWKLHEPIVGKARKSSRSRRGGTAYPLTMDASYTRGEIYRVAHAKGDVRFKGSQNREIIVENFTYSFTSDR